LLKDSSVRIDRSSIAVDPFVWTVSEVEIIKVFVLICYRSKESSFFVVSVLRKK